MATTIVLVRRDLSLSQQLVQACHAVQTLQGERISRMVILDVEDEDALMSCTKEIATQYSYKLTAFPEHHVYYETPMSEYTASAIFIPEGQWVSRITKGYKLAFGSR